jgi:hypothetical protein
MFDVERSTFNVKDGSAFSPRRVLAGDNQNVRPDIIVIGPAV